MVTSAHALATDVGLEVLKNGGNAIDAAVAVAVALAVVYPAAGNLAGGGFMLIRLADGTATVIDYRETAPAAATAKMYLDEHGQIIRDKSIKGHLSVAVPATIAGLTYALEKYGTKRWADLLAPAVSLAEQGFFVTYELAEELKHYSPLLSQFDESKRVLLRNGNFYREGELLKQPELAATLRRLQRNPRDFYEGETAKLIIEEMRRGKGIISAEDLKNYRPKERKPLIGTYRGYEIITVPPPSSGGILLLEMLNMLERYDISSLGHNSSRKYHLLIEVMKRAFADRAMHLGDADFAPVPVEKLISKNYALELSKNITDSATPSLQLQTVSFIQSESEDTTHFSIIDRFGNAVANTYTLNFAYGSGVMVKGAGFLLNNEMDDFAASPGHPNEFKLVQGEKNAIAAGKRPLSSMTPTILVKNGKPLLVLGSPGGPTIINSVLQVIINYVDHRMNIRQAVDAPRIHHQWLPDVVRYEPHALSEDVLEALARRGHVFATANSPSSRSSYIGDVEAVGIDESSGYRLGANDLRKPDSKAAGY
ncbi:MAG: gamma-glutamyltransferase [Acidobacteriota bacterium]|nr:gamma-glutamyltransferase [Blastocatellia bacterium]MDW8413130.1 gamma-glutamyltransferase [Acidobacteriota bacterium]